MMPETPPKSKPIPFALDIGAEYRLEARRMEIWEGRWMSWNSVVLDEHDCATLPARCAALYEGWEFRCVRVE